MNSAYILMLVWYTSQSVPPVVTFKEVDSMDTCRSMSIELSRMIEYTHAKYKEDAGSFQMGQKTAKYKVYCHPKEIK